MKFYLDSANIEEIGLAQSLGWLDGVTTNPSLISKTGRPFVECITEICKVVSGPVSAEVLSLDAERMVSEGRKLAEIAVNVVVKIPMGDEGLKAVKELTKSGIKTNVTLIFSPLQALLAAKAGATMVSPFLGRLDDIGQEGLTLASQIIQIFDNYDYSTDVLAASIRNPMHILECALMGADTVTIPFALMSQISKHPLTDKGLETFMKDAQKIPKGN